MEIIAGVLALGVMFLVYKLIFSGYNDLMEAVKFWFTPDIVSSFRGQGLEDFVAEMKLFFIIISGVLTYIGISGISG